MQVVLLALTSGALQFKVEAVWEQPAPVIEQSARLSSLAGQQGLADIARTPAGKRNESLCIALQPGLVDQRKSALLAFGIGARNQPGKA